MLEAWKKVHYTTNPEYKHPYRLNLIKGSFPKHIKATYFKNTPHPSQNKHFLDGDGQVSKFDITDGNIYYTSKYVQTSHFQLEQSINKTIYKGGFGSYGILPFIKNVSNTNVFYWANKLISFYEAGVPYTLNPKTLETEDKYLYFQEGLPFITNSLYWNMILNQNSIIGDAISAHPKTIDGKLVLCNQQYDQNIKSHITFYDINENHKITNITTIQTEFCYFHDYEVTSSYYIIHQHAFEIDFHAVFPSGIGNALRSKHHSHSKFILIHRKTKTKYVIPVSLNFFISHFVNAKEHHHILELEYIEYPCYMNFTNINIPKARLTKIYIDLKSMHISHVSHSPHWIEFPIQDKLMNASYACFGNMHPQEGICKLQHGKIVDYYKPPHQMFSEVFLCSYLIGALCYDTQKEKTTLQFFIAQSLMSGPIAIFEFPTPIVSLGLHGFLLE